MKSACTLSQGNVRKFKGRYIMRKFGFFISILFLICIFSIPAVAKPKDGKTPAEDTQCDVFKANNVTKGLYGLCVAYCEAGANSESVLANFDRKAKETDPLLRCSDEPEWTCPCLANTSVGEIGADLYTFQCSITEGGSRAIYWDFVSIFESLSVGVDVDDDGNAYTYCLYIDRSWEASIEDFPLTVEEEVECRMAIETLANNDFPGCAPPSPPE